MRPDEKLQREVAGVSDLPREELVVRWQKAHRCLPPKGINRSLLERSAAWHLQAGKLGGLSPAARAMLRAGRRQQGNKLAAGEGLPSGRAAKVTAPADGLSTRTSTRKDGAAVPLAVGTRLMRVWNGRTYVVDVTKEGILFDGNVYRSLTAVALRITGTQWSGPRFFGL